MTLYFGSDDSLPSFLKGGVVLIGHFDGVHRGHSMLLSRGRLWGGGRPLLVVGFSPHARRFFSPEGEPFLLQNLEEKLLSFSSLGADAYCELCFDEHLSSLSPIDFVKGYILEKFAPFCVVVGKDFRFGRGREGDIGVLSDLCGEVHGVESLRDRDLGLVSSTKIRDYVRRGCMDEAGILLGRWYSIMGRVERGAGLAGREGVATANIPYEEGRVRMGYGVYVVRVGYGGKYYYGVGNVGVRPTMGISESPRIEVHLFGCDEDLYGRELRIEFLRRLREEIRFESQELLFSQIGRDVERAKEFFRVCFGEIFL